MLCADTLLKEMKIRLRYKKMKRETASNCPLELSFTKAVTLLEIENLKKSASFGLDSNIYSRNNVIVGTVDAKGDLSPALGFTAIEGKFQGSPVIYVKSLPL